MKLAHIVFVQALLVPSLAGADQLPNPFLPPPDEAPSRLGIPSASDDSERSGDNDQEEGPRDLRSGYPLGEYSVVGTLIGESSSLAIISGPTGETFVVNQGQKFSQRGAIVESISIDEIKLGVDEQSVSVEVGGS